MWKEISLQKLRIRFSSWLENRGGIEVFSISDIITYLQEEMDNIKMPLYGLVFFIAVFG